MLKETQLRVYRKRENLPNCYNLKWNFRIKDKKRLEAQRISFLRPVAG
jgi:hypothetical protein